MESVCWGCETVQNHRKEKSKVSPKEKSKCHYQDSVSNNWSLHSNFRGGETTEASSIWSRLAIVGVSTAQGGETIEETLIASKQVTAGVSTKQGGETTEASPIWSKQVAVWVSTAQGGETIKGNSISSKQVTVGVSTAKRGETTDASSIWSKQVTVGVSTAQGGETIEESLISSKQATVGVSTEKRGETSTTETSLTWSKQVTVALPKKKGLFWVNLFYYIFCIIKYSAVPLPALHPKLSRTLANITREYFANEIVQWCGKKVCKQTGSKLLTFSYGAWSLHSTGRGDYWRKLNCK